LRRFFRRRCDSRRQAIWSIRVPCPGGSAASTVGWGAMASSARPSAFTTGALGALASGMLTGAGAVTQYILIENILRLVSPTMIVGRRMLYESAPQTARHYRQSGRMVNGRREYYLENTGFA
jgi:hypothetical protein